MPTSRWHYITELSEQLRINGAPESEVRDIVAQVEDHIKATGEDPVEAFGQPVDYAAQWQRLTPRHWLTQVAIGALAAVGVLAGVKAILADQSWGGGVPISREDLVRLGVWACLLGVLPWTTGLLESRRRATRLGDSSIPSAWPLRIAGVVGLGALAFTASVLLGATGESSIVFHLPKWFLAAVGVLGVVTSLSLGGPAPNSASTPPRPPNTPPVSLRSRLRRAFWNG